MNCMMITVPMFWLLYSSCMMYHVLIMFLWRVFIDELHDDNSSHVFTTVFIMYDIACTHHVSIACIHRSFIHSETLTVSVILRDPKCLHDENIDENTSRWFYSASDCMKTHRMFPWYLYGNEYMISSLATSSATGKSRRPPTAVAGSAWPWLRER